jgi:hypothetical protein
MILLLESSDNHRNQLLLTERTFIFGLRRKLRSPISPDAIDSPQDFDSCAGASPYGPCNLGLTESPLPVFDGNFGKPQAETSRFRLHFNRPAKVGIAHLEAPESVARHNPKRAEICKSSTPQPPDEPSGEPIAKALHRRESTRLCPAKNPGANDHIPVAGFKSHDEPLDVIWCMGKICIQE